MKIASILVVLSLLSFGCSTTRVALNDDIRRAVNAGQTVDFAALVPSDWDRMLVFSPYTSRDTVAAALGRDWDGFEPCGIDKSDGFYLALFARDQRVVAWARLARDVADYRPLLRARGFSREEARCALSR